MPSRGRLAAQLSTKLFTARTLVSAGMVELTRPDRTVQTLRNLLRFGPTPAAGYSSSAAKWPDEIAVIDELGTLTFRELHERTNALAHALADDGVSEGDGVGLMCRNHRGFVEAVVACSKLGCDVVYLNTAFSGPQLQDVIDREGPRALIYDAEFAGLLGAAGAVAQRYVAWREAGDDAPDDPLVEDLIARGDRSDVVPPGQRGRAIILTSGTTGTPKGAARNQPRSLDPAAALLAMIPLRSRERTMIAAPLFHSWGFVHLTLGMGLGSTLVLTRRFDPEGTLSLAAQHECTALVVVPVMLQRILELDDEVLQRYDLSKLRVVPVSGSALPGPLATKWMDLFGENIYNLYGSTEVAWATIATPKDLRAAPGTAGRPP
jgi:fatty-acyl-CoA synthase